MVGVKIKSEDENKKYDSDFNELDSSHSQRMNALDDVDRDDGSKTMEENNNKIDSVDIKDHVFSGSSRHTLLSNSASSKISVSAFRPVTNDTKDVLSGVAMSPLGPYPPVGATFVGYPDNAGITSPEKEQPLSLNGDKQTSTICLLQPKVRVKPNEKLEEATSTLASNGSRSIESPDTKEYTILQPAASSASKTNSIDRNSESAVTSSVSNAPSATNNFGSSPSESTSTEISNKGEA